MTPPPMSPSFDQGATLADRFRQHLGDETHLYGYYLRGMADDFESGGPVRRICAGWEDAPVGSAIQLRLLAGLFRIVLTGRAPELTPYYPCLGGTERPAEAWPVALDVMSRHEAELRESLHVAPQTNEVARCNALLVGIFAAVRATQLRRIRLLEPGASAGLNLLVDRYRYEFGDRVWGSDETEVVLADSIDERIRTEPFGIVERRGCDPSPIDIMTPEGRLRLKSFVWPFQIARWERLNAAIREAMVDPPPVDRGTAADWLERQLAEPTADGELTIVWHSITRMYWSAEEAADVDRIVASATYPTARVAMEYPEIEGGEGPELVLWLPGEGPEVIAEVGDHGSPVRPRPPAD